MAKSKTLKKTTRSPASSGTFSLFGPAQQLDPTLSSLFSTSAGPILKSSQKPRKLVKQIVSHDEVIPSTSDLGGITSTEAVLNNEAVEPAHIASGKGYSDIIDDEPVTVPRERSRKRARQDDDLEGAYLQRLAKEEAKEATKSREKDAGTKRQKIRALGENNDAINGLLIKEVNGGVALGKAARDGMVEDSIRKDTESGEENGEDVDEDEDRNDLEGQDDDMEEDDISQDEQIEADDSATEPYTIPQHESLSAPTSDPSHPSADLEKSSRTVFLGNVSTTAITSKSAKTTLLTHLSSIFPSLPVQEPPHRIESLRFRSIAFNSALPKKAAFARKDIMDATTHATNAYAVYSTKQAAREAATRLNGTVVLGRHLRVDNIAHPAPVDHRRCVFVGNLGFVDDESAIQAAAAEEAEAHGRQARKPTKSKGGADTEEGLWQVFSKAGTVESVRVVRDAKTRVGKGFAYVQFADGNTVEAALLFDGKRFPPLLPRKLRVVRAKRPVPKPVGGSDSRGKARDGRNAVGAGRAPENNMQSQLGRARKLLGRAGGAATARETRRLDKTRPSRGERVFRSGANETVVGSSRGAIKPPESFVFEGHRASRKQGGGSLRTGPGGSGRKSGGKPRTRSAKRGSAWKTSGGKGSGGGTGTGQGKNKTRN